MSRTASLVSASMAALLTAACGSQTAPGSKEEVLARVQGTVKAEVPPSASGTKAAIVWYNFARDPDIFVAEAAPVRGEFPARFTLEVFASPPDRALNDLTVLGDGETRIGIADILAVPADYDLSSGEDLPRGWGISEHHVLAYIESDIRPGSFGESFVGGALKAGFHILKVVDVDDPSCPGETFDCLRPTEADMDTLIEVHIADPDTLDVPNWT